MSRAHSYAQIPVSESTQVEAGNISQDTTTSHISTHNDNHLHNLAIARSQKSSSSSASRTTNANAGGKDRRGYATLNDNEDDDEDDFETVGEDSAMLRPLTSTSASSASGSGSAPRRPVYPSSAHDEDEEDEDDYDRDNEISIAVPAEGSSSTAASSMNANGRSLSTTAASAVKRNSGARTTNMSFLARLTGRQRPERDAQRMVRSAVDGVFSNLSAKPRVEKPFEEELPPAYKTAAMDVSPAYQETMLPPGFTDDDDMLLVEGLPVGGLFGFMWNMIISMSFQFVGFFLTYLLHTSHATKQGSKTGLGITLMSMGFKMMSGKFPDDDVELDPEEDPGTGYMGNTDPNSGYTSSLQGLTDYQWLSYIILILGMAILIQSVSAFTKVKLSEIRVHLAAHGAALEMTVPASSAAGTSSSSSSTASPTNGATTGAGSGTVIVAMI